MNINVNIRQNVFRWMTTKPIASSSHRWSMSRKNGSLIPLIGTTIRAASTSTTTETSRHLADNLLSDSSHFTNLYGDSPKPADLVAGFVPTSILEEGYDVVVIGGGPSGVSGGFQAALLGHCKLQNEILSKNSHLYQKIRTSYPNFRPVLSCSDRR